MKYFKIILGIIVGVIAITLVAEIIEFLLVKFTSGMSFSELEENQEKYFNIRNTFWILILKFFYSFLAGTVGGYLAAWISAEKAKIAIYSLIIIQVISIIWGAFFSEWSSTGPLWMRIYLLIIIPIGIWIGFKQKIKMFHKKRTN